MSHKNKTGKEKNELDRYKTAAMPLTQKVIFYENKLSEIKTTKQGHKSEITNLKAIRTSSQNILNFKLDETTKKMKNEIYRLSEESKRHEDFQKNENSKVQNQINFLKENCIGLKTAMKDILDRVIKLEKSLG